MKSLATLIISLFLFVLSVEAQTNRFSSTQGFSFDYPGGWIVLTKEQQRILASASKFQVYEAGFKRMFESFDADGGGLWFWHILPKVAQFAIVGALIGIAISLLGTLFKKISGK